MTLFIETLSPARAALYRAHHFRIYKLYGVTDVGVAAMNRLDALFGHKNTLRGMTQKPFNRERCANADRAMDDIFASIYIVEKVRIPNYVPEFFTRRQAS